MARQPGSRIRNYSIEPSTNEFGPKATDPHSPWQLLIEGIRERKKITIRNLAKKADIPSGTLFNWLRSKKGYPSRSIYTSSVNKRLASALGIKEDELAEAYNKSSFSPVNPKAPDPEPPPRPAPQVSENATAFMVDGLKRFMHQLELSGRDSFTLAELKLAASFILGSDSQAT